MSIRVSDSDGVWTTKQMKKLLSKGRRMKIPMKKHRFSCESSINFIPSIDAINLIDLWSSCAIGERQGKPKQRVMRKIDDIFSGNKCHSFIATCHWQNKWRSRILDLFPVNTCRWWSPPLSPWSFTSDILIAVLITLFPCKWWCTLQWVTLLPY